MITHESSPDDHYLGEKPSDMVPGRVMIAVSMLLDVGWLIVSRPDRFFGVEQVGLRLYGARPDYKGCEYGAHDTAASHLNRGPRKLVRAASCNATNENAATLFVYYSTS